VNQAHVASCSSSPNIPSNLTLLLAAHARPRELNNIAFLDRRRLIASSLSTLASLLCFYEAHLECMLGAKASGVLSHRHLGLDMHGGDSHGMQVLLCLLRNVASIGNYEDDHG